MLYFAHIAAACANVISSQCAPAVRDRTTMSTGCRLNPKHAQAWRTFAAGIVRRFAQIDQWLEARGFLSELTASKTDLELQGRAQNDPCTSEVRLLLRRQDLAGMSC